MSRPNGEVAQGQPNRSVRGNLPGTASSTSPPGSTGANRDLSTAGALRPADASVTWRAVWDSNPPGARRVLNNPQVQLGTRRRGLASREPPRRFTSDSIPSLPGRVGNSDSLHCLGVCSG